MSTVTGGCVVSVRPGSGFDRGTWGVVPQVRAGLGGAGRPVGGVGELKSRFRTVREVSSVSVAQERRHRGGPTGRGSETWGGGRQVRVRGAGTGTGRVRTPWHIPLPKYLSLSRYHVRASRTLCTYLTYPPFAPIRRAFRKSESAATWSGSNLARCLWTPAVSGHSPWVRRGGPGGGRVTGPRTVRGTRNPLATRPSRPSPGPRPVRRSVRAPVPVPGLPPSDATLRHSPGRDWDKAGLKGRPVPGAQPPMDECGRSGTVGCACYGALGS